MQNLEIASTVKILESQRAEIQKDVAKIDRVIAVLQEVSGPDSTPAPKGKQPMSAAARRKIGAAQRARWAKVRQAQKAKGSS